MSLIDFILTLFYTYIISKSHDVTFFSYIIFKSEHHNMVWEVKTNQVPNAVQKLLLVMDKRASGMNDSLELLQCNENLPSSPGYNSCDEHMELGKQNEVLRNLTEIQINFHV